MKTRIKLDGIDFEVEVADASFPQAWERYRTSRKEKLDAAEKALAQAKTDAADAATKLQAKHDTEKARADAAETALKAKTDELQKAPDQIRAEIQRRAKLEGVAREVLGAEAKIDELDEPAIMKAVILAFDPEAKLDEVSPAYLAANFDATLRFAGRSALERGSGPITSRADAALPSEEEDDPDGKKSAFAKATAEASKPKFKKARK